MAEYRLSYTAEEIDYLLTKLDTQTPPPVPEYYTDHISQKIARIKQLQDEGGKDAFSFIVMADTHYPSNLGHNSPTLVREIIDQCDIRFALHLGDAQTRGCHATKELLLAENEQIEQMLAPIRDRLLQTEGNHDGSYGFLDRDGSGGYNNSDASGNIKAPEDRETYVYNLTPAEIHSAIYRKVGLVGDVHYDESGSGYYIDDTANKVRYIVLNSHCNKYELQEDGTSKYPKMWVFRFTQSQFDLVIDALGGLPSESWAAVVASHCPLYQEIGDRALMQGVLNAFKNKTTYKGEYAGTATETAYKNLTEPMPENSTDTSKWVNGYRFGSSGITVQTTGHPSTISNAIPCKAGDVIRVKGVTFRESSDRYQVHTIRASNSQEGMAWQYFNSNYVAGTTTMLQYDGVENGIYKFTLPAQTVFEIKDIRFAFPTPTDPSSVIITVNEEITDETTVAGYDAVSVDCDFTNAKGDLTGYFAGHVHSDNWHTSYGFNIITTRCDAHEENDSSLYNERVAGTVTEQSFDVFTVNKSQRKIYATKIGAGNDRIITY